MHVAAIETESRKRRQFEKCRSRIDQEVDALARQHLAARRVPGPRYLAAAAGHPIELLPEFCDQRPHRLGVAGKIGRGGVGTGMKRHSLKSSLAPRGACT